MYAKVKNGVVEKYPYSTQDLFEDNAGVGFPIHLSTEVLAPFNTVIVVRRSAPEVDHTKNVAEGTPIYRPDLDGWEQSWVVSDASAEEIEARTAAKAAQARALRDSMIDEVSWKYERNAREARLGLDPADSLASLDAYVQLLADVPAQPGFPWSIEWPGKP